ncbi:MAG: type II toxin-antitoxin system VapC family toxin [Actinomycetota bacterium]|nr:type II toxin-antitoxin system VapC family toxin [Actinomycetota bacterium]
MTTRGILDTSVVIARTVAGLPGESAISVATLAELHFGVHVARSAELRKGRLHRLAEIEQRFDALPIDDAVARSYGSLAHDVVAAGREPRARTMDILVAATAHAHGLPLYTRNADDFQPFRRAIDIQIV